jgi:hypothetical protein
MTEGGQGGGGFRNRSEQRQKQQKKKKKTYIGWVADTLRRGQAERALMWCVVSEGTQHEGRGQCAHDMGSHSIRDRVKNENECKQRETTQKKKRNLHGWGMDREGQRSEMPGAKGYLEQEQELGQRE